MPLDQIALLSQDLRTAIIRHLANKRQQEGQGQYGGSYPPPWRKPLTPLIYNGPNSDAINIEIWKIFRQKNPSEASMNPLHTPYPYILTERENKKIKK